MNRFLGTYPGPEAIGVKPAGVGTVDVAMELVVVTVVVVAVVRVVVVVALWELGNVSHNDTTVSQY